VELEGRVLTKQNKGLNIRIVIQGNKEFPTAILNIKIATMMKKSGNNKIENVIKSSINFI